MRKSGRIFLYEGPDGGGKTTRINELRRPQDMLYHNGVYPNYRASYNSYIRQIEDYNRVISGGGNMDLYLDRGIISDVIYGQICRDTSPPAEYVVSVLSLLERSNTTVIICLPAYETSKYNWLQRVAQNREYITKVEEYSIIHLMYTALLDNRTHNLLKPYPGIKLEKYNYENSK